MNEKALKTLEYTKIIDQLTEYASTEMGKQMCRELQPSCDLGTIRQSQTFHGTTHILHAAEGETSLHADARQGIGRLRLALPDRPQITGRLQFPAHLFSHLRGGVLRELVDDLCIFESF